MAIRPVTYMELLRRYLGLTQEDIAALYNARYPQYMDSGGMSTLESGNKKFGYKYKGRQKHLPRVLGILRECAEERGMVIPPSYKWWHLDQPIDPAAML